MDTSGLATLIEAMRIARKQDTQLVLRGVQEQPRYLLEVRERDRLFPIEEERSRERPQGHRSSRHAKMGVYRRTDDPVLVGGRRAAAHVGNIHAAYQHPALKEKAYSVLMSGPSGSADIGGKEVHPAQGVMTLTVILCPEPADRS